MFNLKDGIGVKIYPDKEIYFGQWQHGVMNGIGVMLEEDPYDVSLLF